MFFAAAIRRSSRSYLTVVTPLFSTLKFADGNHFAFLTSPTESTPSLAGQPPLIERLSRYLISPHPSASSEEVSDPVLYFVYS